MQNNMLYVEWAGEHILFDTGNGFTGGDTAGWLFEQLEAEGIDRHSIDKIFINHGHFDHVSGLIEDTEASGSAFPNADIYISQVRFGNLTDRENPDLFVLFFGLVYHTVFDLPGFMYNVHDWTGSDWTGCAAGVYVHRLCHAKIQHSAYSSRSTRTHRSLLQCMSVPIHNLSDEMLATGGGGFLDQPQPPL